ncbi:MAG: acetylxylan esterase [Clostridia bacterium]|nr:acetylxylan esterase [Clostridia bacterium]
MEIKGDLCHELLVQKLTQKLAFDGNRNYAEWKEQVQDKLVELLGLKEIEKNACPLNVTIESDEQKEGYRQIRFVFESEHGSLVPCYLLIPNTGKEKYPVAITLQGHTPGFHTSIGVVKYPDLDPQFQPRGAFALQAVKQGYIALAIEQRSMGERSTSRHAYTGPLMCTFPAMVALQLGRTLIGERVWDIQKAIDALSFFPQADVDKIILTGNSGGGTATYYASCLEKRIQIAVPSCSFCSYEDSILEVFHCPCNIIPHAYQWFEMQDLACMIAPRKLMIVAGKEDKIFPIHGVRKGFKTVEKIYEKENAKENCRLIETPKAHWWCEDIVWKAIKTETEKLGW